LYLDNDNRGDLIEALTQEAKAAIQRRFRADEYM
jgi:hypothetical protein